MLNVKQIVHYQVRQEKITLFIYLIMRRKYEKMRIEILSLCLTFFLVTKENK